MSNWILLNKFISVITWFMHIRSKDRFLVFNHWLMSIFNVNSNLDNLSTHFLSTTNLDYNLLDNHKGLLKFINGFIHSRSRKFEIKGKFLFTPISNSNESLVYSQRITKFGFNFSKTINYRFIKVLFWYKKIFRRRRAKHSFIRKKFFRNTFNKFLNSLLFKSLYLNSGLFFKNVLKRRFIRYKRSNFLKHFLIHSFESLLKKKVFFFRLFFKSSRLLTISRIIKFLKVSGMSRFNFLYKKFFKTFFKSFNLSKRTILMTKYSLFRVTRRYLRKFLFLNVKFFKNKYRYYRRFLYYKKFYKVYQYDSYRELLYTLKRKRITFNYRKRWRKIRFLKKRYFWFAKKYLLLSKRKRKNKIFLDRFVIPFSNSLLNNCINPLKYLLSVRPKKLLISFKEKRGISLRLRQFEVLPKPNFGFFQKLPSHDHENYYDSENSSVYNFLMANKNNFFHFFASITNFLWNGDKFPYYSVNYRLLNNINIYFLPISYSYTLHNYINLVFTDARMFLTYYDLLINYNFIIDYSKFVVNFNFVYSIWNILYFLNNVLLSVFYGLDIFYKITFNLKYDYFIRLKFYFNYSLLFSIINCVFSQNGRFIYTYIFFYSPLLFFTCISKSIFLSFIIYSSRYNNDNMLIIFLVSKDSNFMVFSKKYFYYYIKNLYKRFKRYLNNNVFTIYLIIRILGFFIRPAYKVYDKISGYTRSRVFRFTRMITPKIEIFWEEVEDAWHV